MSEPNIFSQLFAFTKLKTVFESCSQTRSNTHSDKRSTHNSHNDDKKALPLLCGHTFTYAKKMTRKKKLKELKA